jgi:cell wall-associated NlpC family hydrolase
LNIEIASAGMAVIAGAATDERLTPETRIRMQYTTQVIENANVFALPPAPLHGSLLAMAARVHHATCYLAIMLASSAPTIAAAASIDPLNTQPAERTTFVDAPAPVDEPLLRERSAGLAIAAMSFIGAPYRIGGSSNDGGGFDCSGFTRHVFALGLGLVLPRSVDEQAAARELVPVGKADLRPGDLVFFNTQKRTFSHVGIYIGGGRFIHAPRTGSEVRLETMRQAYWAARYTGARRAAIAAAPVTVHATLLPTTD